MAKTFDSMREQVLAEIAIQCPHPYHKRRHTEEVIERVTALASYVRPPLGGQDMELVQLAALFHDYGHCGKTIRQTCAGASRTDLSNEEFAAEEAQRRLSGDLTPEQLDMVKNLILATSFGQADPAFAYHRSYKPVTLLEKLLAFADIASFQKPFEEWMDENLRVLQEADPATIPATFEAWLKTRHGFLGYCRAKLLELEPNIDPPHAINLRSKLDMLCFDLEDSTEPFLARFEAVRDERLAAVQP